MLKLSLCFFSVLVLGVPSWASEGFYTKDLLPKQWIPKDLDNALLASHHLHKSTAPFRTYGSSMAISNDGYILTAFHVAEGACHVANRVYVSKNPEHGLFLSKSTIPHRSCDLRIEKYGDMVLEYTGWGTRYFNPLTLDKIDETTWRRLNAIEDDWAIFKVDTGGEKIPCIKRRKSRVGEGSKVWGISWPESLARKNGLSADGSQKITWGYTSEDIHKAPWFTEANGFKGVVADRMAWSINRLTPEYLMLTDADVYIEASGGGLIDSKGRLVGVITNTFYSWVQKFEYEPFDMGAVRVSHIYKRLAAMIGEAKADKVFDCQ